MLTNALNTVGQYGMAGLGALGNLADLPGSAARDLLAGKGLAGSFDQFSTPFSDGNRTSGRELLRHYGMAGQDDTWGNFAGGLAVEAATDPLNLIGGGWLKQAAKARSAAMNANRGIDAANATSMAQRAAGFMPEETIQHLHPVMLGPDRMPKTLYHGTKHVFDQYDVGKLDPYSQYGAGIYTTMDPHVASEYVEKGAPYISRRTGDVLAPGNVKMHYADVRKPFDVDANRKEFQTMQDEFRPPNTSGRVPYDKIQDRLRSQGYDSITHEGGGSMGNKAHQVVIALDPSQMHLPYVAPAIQQLQNVPGHATRTAAALAGHNTLKSLHRREH